MGVVDESAVLVVLLAESPADSLEDATLSDDPDRP